jgi:uncharacterized protein (DUF302 family)
MSNDFTLKTTVDLAFGPALEAVRNALSVNGLGIITEIDMAATLKTKLDVDVAPQVILGACRPQLAFEAMQLNPSVAAVLPCNVVVRSLDDVSTFVEALDPAMMTRATGEEALASVMADARARLLATLQMLNKET